MKPNRSVNSLQKTAIYTLTAFLLASVAVTTGAGQQPAATPAQSEIRSVVLEPGSNVAVPDAEVLLFVQEPGPITLNGGWKTEPSRPAWIPK